MGLCTGLSLESLSAALYQPRLLVIPDNPNLRHPPSPHNISPTRSPCAALSAKYMEVARDKSSKPQSAFLGLFPFTRPTLRSLALTLMLRQRMRFIVVFHRFLLSAQLLSLFSIGRIRGRNPSIELSTRGRASGLLPRPLWLACLMMSSLLMANTGRRDRSLVLCM
jgi:hypothetical protein